MASVQNGVQQKTTVTPDEFDVNNLTSLGQAPSNNIPLAAVGQAARGGFDMIAQITGKEQNDTMDAVYDTAGDIAGQFGYWGLLAQGVIDTWNFIDKMAGKKTTGFKGNTGLAGYQDYTVQDKQYRLTQGGAWKLGEKFKDAQMNTFSKAIKNANYAKMWDQASNQATANRFETSKKKLYGGVDTSVMVGKKGMKIPDLELNITDEDYAVIPDGSLHARKHHLEDISPELKDNITTKGIPVITKDEGGNITQHAEVEKEEVILSLSLTKKLEKLWKEGTDEAKIEAGKILCCALMNNTTDNTGLIERVANENQG